MCFTFDARPPQLPCDLALRPIAGGAGAELLELTSADGTRFSAALAQSPQPHQPAVVILPDMRGLYRFYGELAERFAAAGHHAIAIDYFGRTAGLAPRDDDFRFWPHVQQTTVAQIQADTAAALDHLRVHSGADAVVIVGFCFGGTQSFLAATNPELQLAGVVGFYASLDGQPVAITGPLELAGQISGPLLGLFGGADAHIPVEMVKDFAKRLTAAGVEHEIEIYEGAPHSFFDLAFEQHAAACEDAWRRTLGFLRRVATATT